MVESFRTDAASRSLLFSRARELRAAAAADSETLSRRISLEIEASAPAARAASLAAASARRRQRSSRASATHRALLESRASSAAAAAAAAAEVERERQAGVPPSERPALQAAVWLRMIACLLVARRVGAVFADTVAAASRRSAQRAAAAAAARAEAARAEAAEAVESERVRQRVGAATLLKRFFARYGVSLLAPRALSRLMQAVRRIQRCLRVHLAWRRSQARILQIQLRAFIDAAIPAAHAAAAAAADAARAAQLQAQPTAGRRRRRPEEQAKVEAAARLAARPHVIKAVELEHVRDDPAAVPALAAEGVGRLRGAQYAAIRAHARDVAAWQARIAAVDPTATLLATSICEDSPTTPAMPPTPMGGGGKAAVGACPAPTLAVAATPLSPTAGARARLSRPPLASPSAAPSPSDLAATAGGSGAGTRVERVAAHTATAAAAWSSAGGTLRTRRVAQRKAETARLQRLGAARVLMGLAADDPPPPPAARCLLLTAAMVAELVGAAAAEVRRTILAQVAAEAEALQGE